MKKNVLIFGAGSIGTHHANAAVSFDCDVSICDINPSQYEYMKGYLYPERYSKWDTRISFISHESVFDENKEYDLVVIGVPPRQHTKVLKKCLTSLKYKRVLIEKPFSVFDEDLSFINDLDDNENIFCGFNHSLSKSIIFLKKLILEQKIGNIKDVTINWKEDFNLILKAHPWISSLQASYLSKLTEGGGGCHEYSHALHLALLLRNIIFKGDGKLTSKIIYESGKETFYDSQINILFKENNISINLNIDTTSDPCEKNICINGDKGSINWERKIEDNYEIVQVNKESTKVHNFSVTRPEDFINQMEYLLFEKNIDSNISHIRIESALEVMKILRIIFKDVK